MTGRARPGALDRYFTGTAKWLLSQRVHPNHVTFLQVPFFLVTVWAATHGHKWLFISLIVVVMLLDGLDGTLARVGGMESRTGAVLDSTFDTIGIAIVLWGASQFQPEATTWLLYLFLGNALLYLQNALLEEKVVSYLRGPVLAGVAWPSAMWAALVVCTFVVAWLMLVRLPRTWRALGRLREHTAPE